MKKLSDHLNEWAIIHAILISFLICFGTEWGDKYYFLVMIGVSLFFLGLQYLTKWIAFTKDRDVKDPVYNGIGQCRKCGGHITGQLPEWCPVCDGN